MITKEIIVSDLDRNHDNPIAELVQVACRFDSKVMLMCGTGKINAKSIMGVFAFHPENGMKVAIETDGADEIEALHSIEKFLAS